MHSNNFHIHLLNSHEPLSGISHMHGVTMDILLISLANWACKTGSYSMTANTGACQQRVVKLTELPVIYFADMVLMH